MKYFVSARFALSLILFAAVGCNVSDETPVSVGGNANAETSGATDAGSNVTTDDDASTNPNSNNGDDTGITDSGNADAGDQGECTESDLSGCAQPTNAITSCDVSAGPGVCDYACEAGFSDLNGDLNSASGDGCESTCELSNGGTEICDGFDNDCNGTIDDGYDVGDVCSAGVGACEADGMITCAADGMSSSCNAIAGTPDNETCDGIDNNCDGVVDEGDPDGGGSCSTGLLGACSPGTETCVNGAIECQQNVQSANEDCGADNTGNGIDDDCDGETDEGCAACADGTTQNCYTGPAGTETTGQCRAGSQSCINGAYGSCQGEVVPAAELCNGDDDDCDGEVDENFANLGTACAVGIGACRATGDYVCSSDESGTACNAIASQPSVEICNGIDDDCDGQIDENIIQSCGSDTGACSMGTQACNNGSFGACQGATGPAPETCNGVDDDCDGQVDENISRSCGSNTGACSSGTQSCSNGSFGSCQGAIGPSLEVCNGLDDDCDGQTDENITRTCGTNTGVCSTGTQSCSNGSFGACLGGTNPSPELCGNNADDDCDGQTDENCAPSCSGPQDCPRIDEECCYNQTTQTNECQQPDGPNGPRLCVQ